MRFPRIAAIPTYLAAVPAGLLFVSPSPAAEGGYSNYVPGTYGDFGLALEPPGKLTLRNDLYHYGADTTRTLRSGALTLGVDLEFALNMTTLLYKPGVEVLGGQYAFGTMIPVVHADFEATLGAARVGDNTTGLGDIEEAIDVATGDGEVILHIVGATGHFIDHHKALLADRGESRHNRRARSSTGRCGSSRRWHHGG